MLSVILPATLFIYVTVLALGRILGTKSSLLKVFDFIAYVIFVFVMCKITVMLTGVELYEKGMEKKLTVELCEEIENITYDVTTPTPLFGWRTDDTIYIGFDPGLNIISYLEDGSEISEDSSHQSHLFGWLDKDNSLILRPLNKEETKHIINH